ncbi:MAG: DMT family transporter [Coriobacteriales bacterium]
MLYKFLIVLATLIWGSSFVIVKDTTDAVSPAWILVVRFGLAALILALVYLKKRRLYFRKDYIALGALFGFLLFMGYYLQTIGITDTTPGKNAFLTGTYCVMVPFLAWGIVHKRPHLFNIVAAVMCIAGIGLVSLGSGFSMSFGDLLTLCCAVFYGLHICFVSKFSQDRDIYVLTMWQFFFVTVFSLCSGAIFEQPPHWETLSWETWASLLYLGIACTTLALLFQNIGQQKLPPSTASLLLSLESSFGVAFSVALGAEVLSARMICGFVMIFAAILVSELAPSFLAKRKR